MLEVLDPGPLTTIQDLGRPGWAHLGVSRSGAADRGALTLANRLVGNGESCACLEATFRGPRLLTRSDCVAVLTGGVAAAQLDGSPVAMNTPLRVPAGAVLDIGPVLRGLRTYLAFAGGIDAPLTLGSRSTDTLGNLGPEPLRRGDVITLVRPSGARPAVDAVPAPEPSDDVEAELALGPRDDWLQPSAIDTLAHAAYVVDPQSNRVGIRLQGPALGWARHDELRSEGVVAGALQVPPSGSPLVLLADHPTTGGYPVVGVVASADLDRIAQLRPGGRLHFLVRGRA
jgi:biotin-dependent carboxylase-like uncharacterized protein